MNRQELKKKLEENERLYNEKRWELSGLVGEKQKILREFNSENELVVFQMGSIFSQPQWIKRDLLMDYRMPLREPLTTAFTDFDPLSTADIGPKYLTFQYNGNKYNSVRNELIVRPTGEMFDYEPKVMEIVPSLSNL